MVSDEQRQRANMQLHAKKAAVIVVGKLYAKQKRAFARQNSLTVAYFVRQRGFNSEGK